MKNFLLIVVAVGILAAVPKGRVIAASSRSGPMFANQVRFDGRRLLLATGRTASLWDVTTGVRIREFVGHTEAVRSVDLSPDGRRVLTGAGNTAFGRFGSDASVRLWDAASGKELQRFDGLPQQSWQTYVRAVEFSRDSGKVMSVGGGRGLAVWDVRTGKLLFERPTQGTVLSQPDHPVGADLVLSLMSQRVRTEPEPRLETKLQLWNYRSGAQGSEINLDSLVTAIAWSPDGQTLAVASSQGVRTFSASTGRLLRTYDHQEAVDVTIGAEGRLIASASTDGSIRVWDCRTGRLVGQLRHEGDASRVLIGPDGRRVLAVWHPRVFPANKPGPYTSLWDLVSERELARFNQTPSPAGFSPDGRTIPMVEGCSISACRLTSVVDAATGQSIREF